MKKQNKDKTKIVTKVLKILIKKFSCAYLTSIPLIVLNFKKRH